jgi:phosphatidylserine/phosphatidylglycerophosphate/cardiolipin synthase-like enzyme
MRKSCSGLLATLLILSGCAGLPRHVDKTRSEAWAYPSQTPLGKIVAADRVAADRAAHDRVAADRSGRNLSGIRLLTSGEEALASLMALADHAQRTLDIQYYIIHADDSSRMLLQHVRRAADRGVRVRLLVDDLNTAGEDRRFMHLSQRTNVEVRLFNPFPGGRSAIWSRFLASLNDLPRINHRMHNKLFVADNAIAITGGRNIGDAYFTRDPRSNFIDLDVVAAGAIVPQLSATFDAFWNSRYAYPIASVAAADQPESTAPPFVETTLSASDDWLARELDRGGLNLLWVPATVLADKPAKLASDPDSEEQVTVANDIRELMRSAKQELVIISPYFVPGAEGMVLMRQLVSQGVHIRILTNSLASTDSPLVYTGYSRYRAGLLKLGVELREMRPKLGLKRPRFHPFQSSNASLHAKALVIDQKTVFVGSLNMDGRSRRFNSELGLVMRSSDIAQQVTNILDDVSADGSYRLSLRDHTNQIEWFSGEPGQELIWHSDPETTLTQRIWLGALAPFAPEELL